MKSPKKDRIGCGWGFGVILLLSPLFLHLFGLLRALDILDFLLPMLSLYFFRAYYLNETGIEAKVLFITCRKLRWEDVKEIGFETSRTGLDIRITPRHNSHSVIVLSAEIKSRVALIEAYWGPIQNGRYFYEKMIAEDERRLKKWERGNVFQRLFAKIMRMFP